MYYMNNFRNKMNGLFNLYEANLESDLKEEENEYILTVNVPGVKKENIDISYEDSYLKLSVNDKVSDEEKDTNYILREISHAEVSRSYYIKNVDDTKISAKLEEGILTITLPKLEDKKKNSILID